MRRTIASFLVAHLILSPLAADMDLALRLPVTDHEKNVLEKDSGSRTITLSLRLEDSSVAKIPRGTLVWKTFGYYSIYKIGCISLGLFAVAYATGFGIGAVFPAVLGDDETARDMLDTANLIILLGIGAAAVLAMAGPFIVAHNVRAMDPEAPYNDMLLRGLISEIVCNAAGIALLSATDRVDSGFVSGALGIGGILIMLIPTPAVIYRTYSEFEGVPAVPDPAVRTRFESGSFGFSIAEYPDGVREYSVAFTAARF